MDMDYSKVDDKLSFDSSITSYSPANEAAIALYIAELYPTSDRIDGTTSLTPTLEDMARQRQGIINAVKSFMPAATDSLVVLVTSYPYLVKYDSWCSKYFGMNAGGVPVVPHVPPQVGEVPPAPLDPNNTWGFVSGK